MASTKTCGLDGGRLADRANDDAERADQASGSLRCPLPLGLDERLRECRGRQEQLVVRTVEERRRSCFVVSVAIREMPDHNACVEDD